MRVRSGANFYGDDHKHYTPNWTVHCYEFIAQPELYLFPHEVMQDIELALDNNNQKYALFGRGTKMEEVIYDRTRRNFDVSVGHKLYGTHMFGAVANLQDGDMSKQGWTNGAVYTSWHREESEAEPCLHVAITIYDQDCGIDSKLCCHPRYKRQSGPVLNMGQMLAIEEEIGVHPKYYLGINPEQDAEVLSTIGFLPYDCPGRGMEKYWTWDRIYKALDYVARDAPQDYEGRVQMMTNHGYKLDAGIIADIARTRKIDTALVLVK